MSGPKLSFDQPNRYIGQPVPRADAQRLLMGRGRFVDDMQAPRMVHAAFLRSPVAHGRIVSLDVAAARRMPGVVAVITGADLVGVVEPYVGVLSHLAGLRSAPQLPMAVGRVRWQGEPVAMVLAQSRAEAEDAVAEIHLDLEDLPAATDMERALDPDAPVIHPEFGSNLAWTRTVNVGDVDAALNVVNSLINTAGESDALRTKVGCPRLLLLRRTGVDIV